MISLVAMPRNRCRRLRSLVGTVAPAIVLSLLSAVAPAGDGGAAGETGKPVEDGCVEREGFLDWRRAAPDPDSGFAGRAARCGGRYVDPLADMDTSRDPAAAGIEASAARSEVQGDIVRLDGGVRARQGYRHLRAEEAQYDRSSGLGSLRGNVEFREPGLLMRGVAGGFDSATGAAELTAGRFVLHERHVRGSADLIRRRADEIIELEDARYSYCPPLLDRWVMEAENVELDLERGTGTARNAKIVMGGAPVLYTPYIQFPIDDRRKTGFLWPRVGNDSSGGADIALPYYFHLAPNYDATLTPRYIGDRGLLTEVEGRYLGSDAGYWELGGAWIGGDDEYRNDNPAEDGDRWLIAVEQRGLFRRRWRSRIDYTNVSDIDYFGDLGTTSLQVIQSTHLTRRGELDYLGDDWVAGLRVEEFKTIARDIGRDPYRKLPQITLLRARPERDFALNLLLHSDYTYFDHSTQVTGHRLYNNLGVSYPMNWVWGFLRPVARYRRIDYSLDREVFFDRREDDTPDVGAPLFGLDGGLFFERDTNWGVQTLEPRLYYLWADFEDQSGLPDFDTSELTFSYNQLFRETRFSGKDRLDDANRVSAGLTSRVLDPESGRERLAASIGRIYYFDDRLVNAGNATAADFEESSALAAEFNISPTEALGFRSSWQWDTGEDKLDRAYMRLDYIDERRRIFNLGYSYRRYRGDNPRLSNIRQLDFSAHIPVDGKWSVFLHSLYDLEENDRINDMAGIEYNNCCWRVRLVYQRRLDRKDAAGADSFTAHEHATFLEFQLKGLGGIGNRVGSLLEETIRGYRDRDE